MCIFKNQCYFSKWNFWPLKADLCLLIEVSEILRLSYLSFSIVLIRENCFGILT